MCDMIASQVSDAVPTATNEEQASPATTSSSKFINSAPTSTTEAAPLASISATATEVQEPAALRTDQALDSAVTAGTPSPTISGTTPDSHPAGPAQILTLETQQSAELQSVNSDIADSESPSVTTEATVSEHHCAVTTKRTSLHRLPAAAARAIRQGFNTVQVSPCNLVTSGYPVWFA